ncbi:translation initiation factor 2 [Maritalea mobilis]|uniref:translation initiation factor 2 n=1 Tax=Maritalea mobilis TaxID=483324 RepID=UPI001C939CB4|nr:translation initiation factor 2 [Maritalea mobilis]MBY6201047.1 translation initiation factor 2 [Maritalea mobilis]
MKTRNLSAAAALLGGLTILSGCATVTRGTEDVLEIVTEPAGAEVQTSNGFSCGSTPCAIRMPRRSEFVVTITRPGCRPAQVNVTHRTADAGAAGIAGNVLVGGVIGLGVDAATGASQELVPNPVEIELDC